MSIRYNTTRFNSDRRNGRKGKLPGYSRQPSNNIIVPEKLPEIVAGGGDIEVTTPKRVILVR